jgi:hypothetical protein
LTQKQKICDEETDRAKKLTKRKKTQKQLGQKQETAQQQQKKNSKKKHPDLRSKLSNPKKKLPIIYEI